MTDLESQEEDDPKCILFFNPVSSLGQIRPHRRLVVSSVLPVVDDRTDETCRQVPRELTKLTELRKS